jgi:predicted Fe-Mo cluster-binding NifX family protein
MKLAIPVANGRLSPHFGHCDEFVLVEVDTAGKRILSKSTLQAPPHEPGVLPRWLHEQGATHVIAGGMGRRAQELFERSGVQVILGAPCDTPQMLASAYLAGTLESGENICDH